MALWKSSGSIYPFLDSDVPPADLVAAITKDSNEATALKWSAAYKTAYHAHMKAALYSLIESSKGVLATGTTVFRDPNYQTAFAKELKADVISLESDGKGAYVLKATNSDRLTITLLGS